MPEERHNKIKIENESGTRQERNIGPKIPRAPLSLFISITSRCNQSCKHCSVYSDDLVYGPDLTTDEWIRFFEEIARIKVFRVKISGGEPFARKDIFTLLETLDEKPIRLSINTNATLITDEIARRLSRLSAKLDDIMVSFDGARAESHDALRGHGAFDAARAGISRLQKYVGNTTAYTTVTRLNALELKGIASLLRSFGIESMKFNELLLEGRGLKYKNELILSPLERARAIETLHEMKGEFPAISGTFFEANEIFSTVKGLFPQGKHEERDEENYLSGCGALTDQCAIRPDGYATPCDRLPDLAAGKILETPLVEIWQSSPVFTEFRKRYTTPITALITCRSCEYAPLCTGGCAAAAYYTYGTTLARDPASCYRLYREGLARKGREA